MCRGSGEAVCTIMAFSWPVMARIDLRNTSMYCFNSCMVGS